MLTRRVLLAPSTPTLLIDERRGDFTDMLAAFAEQSRLFEEDAPDAVVVVTSRWIGTGLFHVDDAKRHTSLIDLPGFGVEPRYDCAGDPALARTLVRAGRRAKLPVAVARRGADTGVSVPLHLLTGGNRLPVVPVSLSDVPGDAHRRWGAVLRDALEASETRVAFVVSGPLTFSEHDFNLKREIAEDRDLDARALDALKHGAWDGLGETGARPAPRAHPEAGWRHLEVLRGFLGTDATGRVCAYEALPGIGAALAEFGIAAPVGAPNTSEPPAS